MSASIFSNTYLIDKTSKSTGFKSIDQLIKRYTINLSDNQSNLADNPFQKSLVLSGQDNRLAFVNLPYCMYAIISQADIDDRFTVHRFYLPHKNGLRFATYLLNNEQEVIESVCYQRSAKYITAFKAIRMEFYSLTKGARVLAA